VHVVFLRVFNDLRTRSQWDRPIRHRYVGWRGEDVTERKMEDWLAKRFEEHRTRLRAVALRMLGSRGEADDAVQEAWMRLGRADGASVENLGGWLTTVIARVCLDMLRARGSRREEPLDARPAEPSAPLSASPDAELLLADSIAPALLVVLETLAPAERVAFVLHDLFDLPFEEIAAIVGRSEPATRQLASRARRRVQGAPAGEESDRPRRRAVVDAFLAASRDGNLEALLAVLAPGVVLRADELAVRTAVANRGRGAPDLQSEMRGARAVAESFGGRARGARPALLDGEAGAVWAVGGQTRAAFVFTVEDGRVTAIDLIMEPARLGEIDVQLG
jgi:RNA polymerase sigma-70 factor, ECF subfamily